MTYQNNPVNHSHEMEDRNAIPFARKKILKKEKKK